MNKPATPQEQQITITSVLRPLVPESLRKERGIYLRLGPVAGPIYARLRTLDALGVRSANTRSVPCEARSFVFVCYGNIMRSPMAELMFKRAAAVRTQDRIGVQSAGIHAIAGTPAHPRAQIAAQQLGFPLDYHRSQLLTADMVNTADAIIAMDFQNKAELLANFPGARSKIFMMSAYARGTQRGREIPDPFFGDQDAAVQCYTILHDCVNNLAESLWPASASTVARKIR